MPLLHRLLPRLRHPQRVKARPVVAPLGGNIFKVLVSPGDTVEEGDVMIILEAMKMETEVRAPKAGTIGEVFIKVGDAVSPDDEMLTIA